MNINNRFHDLINDSIGLKKYLSEFQDSNSLQLRWIIAPEWKCFERKNGFLNVVDQAVRFFNRITPGYIAIYFPEVVLSINDDFNSVFHLC